jgi:hypothetical protein
MQQAKTVTLEKVGAKTSVQQPCREFTGDFVRRKEDGSVRCPYYNIEISMLREC